MKIFLINAFLFTLVLGVFLQRPPDPSGRRGDVVSLGDIDDQTIFNVDNSGGANGNGQDGKGGGGKGGGGKGGGGKGGGGKVNPGSLDCDKIIRECQCYGPPPTAQPGPKPTGQYQMEYDMYDRYGG